MYIYMYVYIYVFCSFFVEINKNLLGDESNQRIAIYRLDLSLGA